MRIRIVGCGAMGSAIAHTMAEGGHEIALYDKSLARAEGLAKTIKATVYHAPLEGVVTDEVFILAVKPQDFSHLAEELKGAEMALMVSIITGVSIAELKASFPGCTTLRTMPNLAVRYGDGIVALAEDPSLAPYQKRIEEILSPLGVVKWLPEHLFEAVTALTGSAPAFVLLMVEAFVDAAIALGFSAEVGYELVKQMIGGTLTMLYESPELPSELRWKIASPAGTTIAGLRKLEEKGLRSALIEGVLASAERAHIMSTKKKIH